MGTKGFALLKPKTVIICAVIAPTSEGYVTGVFCTKEI